LTGICIVPRANKLKCNAVAHLLHQNVETTSEEKSSQSSNPSGLSKTGNLLRCGRFAVCAYTCTSRALHLACFGQSQNLGSNHTVSKHHVLPTGQATRPFLKRKIWVKPAVHQITLVQAGCAKKAARRNILLQCVEE